MLFRFFVFMEIKEFFFQFYYSLKPFFRLRLQSFGNNLCKKRRNGRVEFFWRREARSNFSRVNSCYQVIESSTEREYISLRGSALPKDCSGGALSCSEESIFCGFTSGTFKDSCNSEIY